MTILFYYSITITTILDYSNMNIPSAVLLLPEQNNSKLVFKSKIDRLGKQNSVHVNSI